MSASEVRQSKVAADHPNQGKCLSVSDEDCALKGGVCRCLSGVQFPSTVKGTEVAGLNAR